MKRTPISESKSTKLSRHIQVPESEIDLNFFFKRASLRVEGWESMSVDGTLTLYVSSSSNEANCPYCSHQSDKVHSRYTRTLCDLPAFGKTVQLCFHARKFFCLNAGCKKKTFAEQPGNEIFRYRRRTRRCEVCVHRHGLAMSSPQCSMLLKSMGIKVSGATVLRDLHKMEIPDSSGVKRIGIDDWAFRKGASYGSLIVDLTTGRPIDMLPGRSERDFSEWLAAHKSVWLISRDRATSYSSAAASCAGAVTEVADRFHLIKNLGECVSDIIMRRYEEIRGELGKYNGPEECAANMVVDKRKAYAAQRIKEVKRLQAEGKDIQTTAALLGMAAKTVRKYRKMDADAELEGASKKKAYVNEVKFNEVKRLQSEGKDVRETASMLGMSPNTVVKYRAADSFPVPVRRKAPGLGSHTQYVEEQHGRGVSLNQIYKNLTSTGLVIERTTFYRHFSYLPDGHRGYRSALQKARMEEEWEKGAACSVQKPVTELPPSRQLSNIVMRSVLDKKLSESETALLATLTRMEWLSELHEAARTFRDILKSGCPSRLDAWVEKYRGSSIPRFTTFINGIRRDTVAIKNAVLFKESNGILEGYVNKLKTIKRSMYGRAKLNLLRIKMVRSAFSFN